jgi:hypothetical protein
MYREAEKLGFLKLRKDINRTQRRGLNIAPRL